MENNSHILKIKDNCVDGQIIDDADVTDLSTFANKDLKNLVEANEGLLVFPESLGKYGDDLGSNTICRLEVIDGKHVLKTGNIAGFVGVGNTRLHITSRFDDDENDYFLYYMLSEILSINVFDLKFGSDNDSIIDFLIYLFPYYLNEAVRQGIYREYQSRDYNNDRVKCHIDVARHIMKNIPFQGNVAYSTREIVYDNPMNQLIRHTIEYIKTFKYGGNILERDQDTVIDVKTIIAATPTYEKQRRQNVINANLRPTIHPFYSAYQPLQKLCIQILHHESIRYRENKDEIFGVLFDIAWLWEEYMAKRLSPIGFKHARNKLGSGKITLFEDKTGERFPDYYIEGNVVLDAKYKRLEKASNVSDADRNDLHQVISYMHVLSASIGGLVYPTKKINIVKNAILKGFGGKVALFGVVIPQNMNDWKQFVIEMEANCDEFANRIIKHINN